MSAFAAALAAAAVPTSPLLTWFPAMTPDFSSYSGTRVDVSRKHVGQVALSPGKGHIS
jgi:hypothetical protein